MHVHCVYWWTVQKALLGDALGFIFSFMKKEPQGSWPQPPAALLHANGFLMASHSWHTLLYWGAELFREGKPHFLIVNIYCLQKECVHVWAHIHVFWQECFIQLVGLCYICTCVFECTLALVFTSNVLYACAYIFVEAEFVLCVFKCVMVSLLSLEGQWPVNEL